MNTGFVEVNLVGVGLIRYMSGHKDSTKLDACSYEFFSLKNSPGRRIPEPYTIIAEDARRSFLYTERMPSRTRSKDWAHDGLFAACKVVFKVRWKRSTKSLSLR